MNMTKHSTGEQSFSNGGNKSPLSDPTFLTTQQLLREMESLKDLVFTRLDAMDKAMELFNANITRVPTDTDKQISHLKELHAEKFGGVEKQFRERDIRAEREARDNKVAVDAAFAAQKEAAAKQDEANAKAIDKSEKSTSETIKTNQELSISKIESLTSQVNDFKTGVATINSIKQGSSETKGQANWSKNIKEAEKGKIVPGASFDMDIYVADSGKKYVNSVNGMLEVGSVPKTAPKYNAPKTVSTTAYTGRKSTTDDTMSKAEWAAKDQRISRQGCIQAAVQALAPALAIDVLFENASKLADQMLGYVNPKV